MKQKWRSGEGGWDNSSELGSCSRGEKHPLFHPAQRCLRSARSLCKGASALQTRMNRQVLKNLLHILPFEYIIASSDKCYKTKGPFSVWGGQRRWVSLSRWRAWGHLCRWEQRVKPQVTGREGGAAGSGNSLQGNSVSERDEGSSGHIRPFQPRQHVWLVTLN